MEKLVNIGEKEVNLKANGLTPILFKMEFDEDLIEGVSSMQNKVDAVFLAKLTYVMAKAADKGIVPFEEWLESFEPFDILMSAEPIIDLWAVNEKQTSKPAKK